MGVTHGRCSTLRSRRSKTLADQPGSDPVCGHDRKPSQRTEFDPAGPATGWHGNPHRRHSHPLHFQRFDDQPVRHHGSHQPPGPGRQERVPSVQLTFFPAVEPGNMLGPAVTAPDAATGTAQNPNSITDEITVIYADNTSGLEAKPINQPQAGDAPPIPDARMERCNLTGTQLTITFDANCVNLTTAGITSTR